VILNWVVGNETCDVASKKADSYAWRSNNSKCKIPAMAQVTSTIALTATVAILTLLMDAKVRIASIAWSIHIAKTI
jgi:hypothetical protein